MKQDSPASLDYSRLSGAHLSAHARATHACAYALICGTAALIIAFSIALTAPAPNPFIQQAWGDTAAEKQAEAQAVLAQLNTMQQTLDRTSAEYGEAMAAIAEAQAQQEQVGARIDEINTEMDSLQDRLSSRAVDMYRVGPATFLDLLLGSTSFEEFATNWDLLTKMNESDAALIDEERMLRAELEQQEAELEQQIAIAQDAADAAAEAKDQAMATVGQMQATYDSLTEEALQLLEEERAAQAAAQAAAAQEVLDRMAESADIVNQQRQDNGSAAPGSNYNPPSPRAESGAGSDGGSRSGDDSSGSGSGGARSNDDLDARDPDVPDADTPEQQDDDADDSGDVPADADEPGDADEPDPEPEPEPEPEDEAPEPAPESDDNADDDADDAGNTQEQTAYEGGSDVVSRAYACLGAPYEWGGVGPYGYDCSGLVSYCLTGSHSRLGTTYTFMGWTRVSDPQPGDVCTSSYHCGIYIGNGQMIHASDYGVGVIIGPVQSDMIIVRW